MLHTERSLEELNVHLAALEDAGLLGAIEQDGTASAYFPTRAEGLPVDGRWEPVADEDWSETWKAGLQPVRVGALVVTPPWHATGAAGEIVVEPGQAFGTGHHETTAGCLAALQELPLAGARVLDVGTGSGVLAVASAMLGAHAVVAVDTDPLAVDATAAGAQVNGVDVAVSHGSAADVVGDFDVVVANLDTATLCDVAEALAARVAPGGTLIASGVSRERAGEARAALVEAGLAPVITRGDEWVVIVARHQHHDPHHDQYQDPYHELELDGITHGGEAVGRLRSGKACFVPYAIPGERVRVEIVEDHKRWARGRLVEILEASRDRITPPCPYFGAQRCGGCALQHIADDRQAQLKRRIVTEQLERIGGLTRPPVAETVQAQHYGYRNHARFGVDPSGRLGFHGAGTNEVVPIDRCLLLHPDAQAVRDEAGDAWAGTERVAVRVGVAGKGTALLVEPGQDPLPSLPSGSTPVALVDATGQVHALRGDPTVRERVAGFEYRVSAGSFFQANTGGAEALVALVREAAAVGPGDAVADLYAGVGLFARPLAADGATVVAVEGTPSACEDARVNLAGTTASVLCTSVRSALGRFLDEEPAGGFDVVVLDPPRKGAGRDVCGRIARLRPRTVVYVSCDPAALARDARVLTAAGYPLVRATPVDQFAQTAAIETVAVFAR